MSRNLIVPAALLLAVVASSVSAVQQPVSSAVASAGQSLVAIRIVADGEARVVGSGVVVRSDGIVLTAYHLVRGAPGIQVALASGDVFDGAELVTFDERRNVALLRIPAAGLVAAVQSVSEESLVGSQVAALSMKTASPVVAATGVVTSVSLATEVQGAGEGFRILRFSGTVPDDASGGVLVDSAGRVVGILAAVPSASARNYAVPMSALQGHIRGLQSASVFTQDRAATSQAPYAIPQSSVSVPQRGVTRLDAKGPGSVVIKPMTPAEVLRQSKTIYVQSRTAFFKPEQLVNELNRRPEIAEWGLMIVDERDVADIVLTLDHLLFTYKFSFQMVHQRTGVVVASGDAIIFDGNLGAPKMAKRVVEKLRLVLAPAKTAEPQKKTK